MAETHNEDMGLKCVDNKVGPEMRGKACDWAADGVPLASPREGHHLQPFRQRDHVRWTREGVTRPVYFYDYEGEPSSHIPAHSH